MIKDIFVINDDEYVEVRIFNSAGEIVRVIRESRAFNPETLALSVPDVVAVAKDGAKIIMSYGGNPGDNFIWDGRNSAGLVVSNGAYEIQVVAVSADGKISTASKTVMLLNESRELFSGLKAYPNPFLENDGIMTFAWQPKAEGAVTLKIYNIAGQAVRRLTAKLADGSVPWDFRTDSGQAAAGGVYVCVFEAVSSDGYRKHEIIKIAAVFRNTQKDIY